MKSRKVVILQSNYVPWKGYFDLIHDADIFVFYDEVKYTKNDWRNRNILYPKGGAHWLTIPVSKDSVKLRISEVDLPDPSWQKIHFNTILGAYKKAPWFGQILPLLEEVYIKRKWEKLSALNQFIIISVSALLGIKTEFLNAASIDLRGDRIDRLLNMLTDLQATHYISGPSASVYLGEDAGSLFAARGIQLSYKEYGDYPVYRQWSEPFLNNVSVIDLLAHVELSEIPFYLWGHRNS